jgi:hypothetical protein
MDKNDSFAVLYEDSNDEDIYDCDNSFNEQMSMEFKEEFLKLQDYNRISERLKFKLIDRSTGL